MKVGNPSFFYRSLVMMLTPNPPFNKTSSRPSSSLHELEWQPCEDK